MIVAQRQRRHQARLDFAVAHDRFHRAAAEAEDGDFRQIDDRREMRAANRALVGNRERAAFHFFGGNFPVARFRGERFQFLRQIEHGFFVHVADDRNHQALVRVHRDAEMDIFLDDDFVRRLRRGWN